MNSVNQIAVVNMLQELEKYRTELNRIQDQEESEFVDQALDDLELVIEDMNGAMCNLIS